MAAIEKRGLHFLGFENNRLLDPVPILRSVHLTKTKVGSEAKRLFAFEVPPLTKHRRTNASCGKTVHFSARTGNRYLQCIL